MPQKTTSPDNFIGLAELIERVKQDLLLDEESSETVPLFSVEEVCLELQVTVRKEGRSGLKIYVVELGGGAARDDIQKVKVKLVPLLDKDTRLRLYKARSPEKWSAFLKQSVDSLNKGSQEGSLDDLIG